MHANAVHCMQVGSVSSWPIEGCKLACRCLLVLPEGRGLAGESVWPLMWNKVEARANREVADGRKIQSTQPHLLALEP